MCACVRACMRVSACVCVCARSYQQLTNNAPLVTKQAGTVFRSHWFQAGFRGGGAAGAKVPVFLMRRCPDNRYRLVDVSIQ